MKYRFSKGIGNYNLLLSLLKQRVTATFVRNHNARLQTLNRARFFNLFSSFQWQDYLNIIKVPKDRNSLIRFRLSSHRLAVKSGDRINLDQHLLMKENVKDIMYWKMNFTSCSNVYYTQIEGNTIFQNTFGWLVVLGLAAL